MGYPAPDCMGLNPVPASYQLCECGQSANCSVPQYPHLQNEDHMTIFLLELLRGSNETMCGKCL